MARADLVAPGPEPLVIRITIWIFAGYLALNTLGNAVSKSKVERYTMAPASATLVVCLVAVALS